MPRVSNAPRNLPDKVNESSEEDNELGEETISGENDVEYAEFSLSLRTSPKEQISNKNKGGADANDATAGSKQLPSNGIDEFLSLPVFSSKPLFWCLLKHPEQTIVLYLSFP